MLDVNKEKNYILDCLKNSRKSLRWYANVATLHTFSGVMTKGIRQMLTLRSQSGLRLSESTC